jgi:glycosyltransferase involved in cell wall biosynthesis
MALQDFHAGTTSGGTPKILVHSSFNPASIRDGLGRAEYSYHFVVEGFLPALMQLGEVVRVGDPAEVDAIFDACVAQKRDCVFLCFAPPHFVPITLRCPTIPVLAWEFSTIPCEMWSDDPRSDWRVVFRHCGRAITLSRHTAALVRQAMGPDFPVFPIPTATYDAFAPLFRPQGRADAAREIRFRGMLFDSRAETLLPEAMVIRHTPLPDLPAETPVAVSEPPPEVLPRRRGARERISLSVYYGLSWYRDVLRDLLPAPLKAAMSAAGRGGYRLYRVFLPLPQAPAAAKPLTPEASLQLNDIVYVAVLAPQDGRKNWHDLLTGFLWAFRDQPRATLVLKMPHNSWAIIHGAIENVLSRFSPFSCRVVLIYGFLEDAEYATLIDASDFYVNASYCEGLSIPLMEFLSAGKPAIAPDHTALADYVTPRLAFVLRGTLEHNVWPFDPRDLFTTMRHRTDWSSLEQAYRESFATVAPDGAYAGMAQAAHDAMREYCSVERVCTLLAQALDMPTPFMNREAAE